MYATIDTESRLSLKVNTYSCRGTDPAAEFLYCLTENHDVADTKFLLDSGGNLIALAWHELSGHLDYSERNHIAKWFQTVTKQIDRIDSVWRDIRRARDEVSAGSGIITTTNGRIKR